MSNTNPAAARYSARITEVKKEMRRAASRCNNDYLTLNKLLFFLERNLAELS